MTSLINVVLFHFIFYLLSISMVITNIKKTELISATESCLFKYFLCQEYMFIN